MLMTARSEIEEMQKERAHQTETMLDNIRDLSRQLRLSMLVIDHYVPPEHQDQIEQRYVVKSSRFDIRELISTCLQIIKIRQNNRAVLDMHTLTVHTPAFASM